MKNFKLFPAIDLIQGKCVRLSQGEFSASTTYNEDPLDQAKQFEQQGFDYLHIVDLDGAAEKSSHNKEIVEKIITQTKLNIQLGGGIRNLDQISRWINTGVISLVLGTVAVKDPELVNNASQKFPGNISVGLDCRDNNLAIRGWKEQTVVSIDELLDNYSNLPLASFIVTDIARDGMLSGPNIELLNHCVQKTTIPVIASGGISSINDLAELVSNPADPETLNASNQPNEVIQRKISGAIIGRALYDGSISAEEALITIQ